MFDPSPAPPAPTAQRPSLPSRVLLVDDDQLILVMLGDALAAAGHAVETAPDAPRALALAAEQRFDVVITDLHLPGMDGLGLLAALRQRGLEVPVLIMTGTPGLPSAMLAVEHGALRYLVKPVLPAVLLEAVEAARRSRGGAGTAGAAPAAPGHRAAPGGVEAPSALEAAFARALASTWIAFQPVVRPRQHRVFAYEALLRTREPGLTSPLDVVDAAERLQQVHQLGRLARARVAQAAEAAPEGALIFVNLHPYDLSDEALYDPAAPLGRMAGRVVLEITERHALQGLGDVEARARALRALGYRLAIDDLGAGHAGLPSFALLDPEIVKIDMSLTRGVDARPRQQTLVRSLARMGADLGAEVVAEGVETAAERDALLDLGCDLLQGYLFARPAEGFPGPAW